MKNKNTTPSVHAEKKYYVSPAMEAVLVYTEYSIATGSSATITPGGANANFQPEIEGTDSWDVGGRYQGFEDL